MIYGNKLLPKEYITINEINLKISEFPILYEIAQTTEEKKNIISRLFSDIRKLISKAAEIFKEKWNIFITKIKTKLKSFSKMNLKKKFLLKFRKDKYINIDDDDYFNDDDWDEIYIEFTKPIEVFYKNFIPLLKEWLSAINNGKNIVDHATDGLEANYNFFMDVDKTQYEDKSISIHMQDIFKPLPKGLHNYGFFMYNINELNNKLADYVNEKIYEARDRDYYDCKDTKELDNFISDFTNNYFSFLDIFENADKIYTNCFKTLADKYNKAEQYANNYLTKAGEEDNTKSMINVHRSMQEPLNMCTKVLSIIYNIMLKPIANEARSQHDDLIAYTDKLKGVDGN